jgi:hypothetical protein
MPDHTMKSSLLCALAVFALGTCGILFWWFYVYPTEHKIWGMTDGARPPNWATPVNTNYDVQVRTFYLSVRALAVLCFVPVLCYFKAWYLLALFIVVEETTGHVAYHVL